MTYYILHCITICYIIYKYITFIFRCFNTKNIPRCLLPQKCLLRFFIGLFCIVSLINDWTVSLLPVSKCEHVTLLSSILDHSLYLRGKYVTVLCVRAWKWFHLCLLGALPGDATLVCMYPEAAHPFFMSAASSRVDPPRDGGVHLIYITVKHHYLHFWNLSPWIPFN